MIQIPFNDLIKKIKEKSNLSEEDINNKIKRLSLMSYGYKDVRYF